MMNNKLNKIILSSIMLIPLLGSNISYSSQNMYMHELDYQQQKLKIIIDKYAPNNISRTTFNGFKNSGQHTVNLNNVDYTIHGLPQNKESQEFIEARQNVLNVLPNDYAYFSNTVGGLYVKSSDADNQGDIKITYGYKPGPLDYSGNLEYSFAVQPKVDFLDKSTITFVINIIDQIPDYMIFDREDRKRDIITQMPTAHHLRMSNNDETNQLTSKLLLKITDLSQEYQKLTQERISLLNQYNSCTADNQAILRTFSSHVLQYRNFLIKSANDLAIKNSKLVKSANLDAKDVGNYKDTVTSFFNNTNNIKASLLLFPEWFINKDLNDHMYKSFYKGWK